MFYLSFFCVPLIFSYFIFFYYFANAHFEHHNKIDARSAHGYTYSVPLNSSYNPVSRQDSERQSCSSASLTDSEVNSK